MKKKIMLIFKIGLSCIVGFFAFYGLLCFVKNIAESGKTEEKPYIHYTRYNTNDETEGDFLVISGNGKVSKEVIDGFENVAVIFVCESILGIEPNAFCDVEDLKLLIMVYAIYPDDMELPMQTDLLFIEDNEYMSYLNLYI